MDAMRPSPAGRRWGRAVRFVAIGVFALAALWWVVPRGAYWTNAGAEPSGNVSTAWLEYAKPAKPGEPENPRVLRLVTDILVKATEGYEKSDEPPVKTKILEVVDELHACMAGEHAQDRAEKYDKLRSARTKAQTAQNEQQWEEVRFDLMHGH